MANSIPPFLLEGNDETGVIPLSGKGRLKLPFLDRGLKRLAGLITAGYRQWEAASGKGVLHRLDPRVKVISWIVFLVIVSIKREVMAEAWIAVSVALFAAACRTDLKAIYGKAAGLAFFFGFLIALPSGLNLVTPGEIVLPLIELPGESDFLIYQIPQVIGFTRTGVSGIAMLSLRVFNSVTLSLLVLYTTPFNEIITSLRVLKVPDTFIMVITLSYKYILLFARTVEEMHLAKKSRLAGEITGKEARRWIAGRMGLLFKRTQMRCEEVYKAMTARGFSDGFHLVRRRGLTGLDWGFCGLFLVTGGLFLWI